jgi:signal transduction histidine kinase
MMELLINDLLDQAKFENDKFKLTVEKFDLSLVVWKAFKIAQSKANFNRI